MFFDDDAKFKAKMHSDKRALVLKPKPGEKPKSETGLVDPRLFTGENNIFAVRHPPTSLWSFKYESGILPQSLKKSFTNINALVKYAEEYFGRRGMEIVEVRDA